MLVGLSEARKRALRLADNKIALNAGWDLDLLKEQLGELASFDLDLSLTGFSAGELDLLPADAATEHGDVTAVVVTPVAPGSVNTALVPLRMGTKLDRYRPSVRMMLKPWLVEAALARLGERRLSREEQAKVVQAVRTPHKVRWPVWWEVTL